MSLPNTTMSGLVAAILSTLSGHGWPSPIRQIGYRQPDAFPGEEPPEDIQTPAVLLNCTQRQLADSATADLLLPGRDARLCRFELHLILSTSTENAALESIEFAESAMALLNVREVGGPQRGNRFGLGEAVGYPQGLTDDDGTYSAGWHGCLVRVLSWDQVVYLDEVAP